MSGGGRRQRPGRPRSAETVCDETHSPGRAFLYDLPAPDQFIICLEVRGYENRLRRVISEDIFLRKARIFNSNATKQESPR